MFVVKIGFPSVCKGSEPKMKKPRPFRFGITSNGATTREAWLAVEQIIHDLQMRRERFGISYIVLRENMADAFAPVVERLAGA